MKDKFESDLFANEQPTENITWCNISNGMIVVRSDEEDPKAKSRINKLGRKVYERFFPSIAGIITGINISQNDYGEVDLKVKMKTKSGSLGCLTIKLDSSYGRSFLAQIFNIDITKEVRFSPWQKTDTENDRKVTRLYLNHGKEKVLWSLPEGTPEVKWVETKKGSVIDTVSKAKHDEFLEDKLNEFLEKNGLVWKNDLNEILEDIFPNPNVDTSPLTDDEKKKLVKPVSKKVKYDDTPIEEVDMDDFFKDL